MLLNQEDKIKLETNLDIYFICFSESAAQEAIIYVEKLKDEIPSLSIKTNLGLESVGSQFKKADKSGAKIALVIGEDELKDKKITLKDLRLESNQETLTFEDLVEKIKIKN